MNISELKNRLTKSADFLRSELSQIRTGRASPQLISDIQVEVYDGTKMSIKEVGSISVTDSHNLVITPWDKNVVSKIAKAVRDSDLGLSAAEEVNRVRVMLPVLTEERRKEFVKEVNELVEESKNSIRNIRKDVMKDIDKDFSEKNISEDQKFKNKEQVDEIIKEFTEKIEELGESKRKELMTV